MPDNIATNDSGTVKKSEGSTTKKKRAPRKKSTKPAASVKSSSKSDLSRNGPVLVLDSVLVINNANALHEKFSSYLNGENKEIVIDASKVEMLDTAIAQLIYSFVRELHGRDTAVIWESVSEEFFSRIRSLGLAALLGIGSDVVE